MFKNFKSKLLFFTTFASLFLFFLPQSANASIIFQDDFNAPDGTDVSVWKTVYDYPYPGYPRFIYNGHVQTYYSFQYNVPQSDYCASYDFLNNGVGYPDMILRFDVNSDTGYYFEGPGALTNGNWRIVSMGLGEPSLATGNYPGYLTISNIKACAIGSTLSFYVDGQLLGTAQDTRWVSGKTYLQVLDENSWIDNFKIESAPEPTIADLINNVQAMNLQQGIENSLDAKLTSAQDALNAQDNGQISIAVNKLNAFINEVEAQRGNKLTDAQADELITYAQNLINLIQGN